MRSDSIYFLVCMTSIVSKSSLCNSVNNTFNTDNGYTAQETSNALVWIVNYSIKDEQKGTT